MTSPDENQLVRIRLEKLGRLRAAGIDPYPRRFDRTHSVQEALALFAAQEGALGADGRTEAVTLAGRIVGSRAMGRARFLDILDGSGRLQALFRRDLLHDSFDLLRHLDVGDWLGVEGTMFRTRAGEVTVEARGFAVLCKSIRPLPEKWHGLADVEIRFRQRYLDLISNEEARRTAVLRSRVTRAMRGFLDARGFIEVETPILVPVAAGAMARPFVTHHNALDRDLYLRIATELYLKRLVVGGLEKVYEIGHVFRNEGVDYYHNPEFTMLESYEAYADYSDVMRMVEEMVHAIAQQTLGKAVVEFDGQQIDLTPPWPRLGLRDEVIRRAGIDILACPDLASLRAAMENAGFDAGSHVSWGGLADKLVSDAVEPHLVQPTFLVDYPTQMSPLAKKRPDEPRLVERFEGFVAGKELCNSFTELNDPVDQRKRFEEQETLRRQFADEDLDRLDEDFLVAIEHGMPPTGGLGMGVDRLVMLLSGQRTIREVVLFPQMRSR